MYKVVVADDEAWIRKGIVTMLRGIDPTLDIVEAADGEEAIGRIVETDPDFVVLDIKMPKRDGLEVLTGIREKGVKAEVLILSGYSEFDYAQHALNHGACGYLLKPVGSERMTEKVTDILHAIEKRRHAERVMAQKDSLEQSQAVFQVERAANMLLHSRRKTTEADRQAFVAYLEGDTCSILLFHLNNLGVDALHERPDALDHAKRRMREVLQTVSVPLRPVVFDNYRNELEVFVLFKAANERLLDEAVKAYLAAVAGAWKENAGVSACTAFSPHTGVPDGKTYDMLRKALDERFAKEGECVYACGRVGSARHSPVTEDELRLLGQLLAKADYEGIKGFLDNVFCRRAFSEGQDVRAGFIEIVNFLVRMGGQLKVDISHVLTEMDLTAEILDYLDDTTDISDYLHSTIMTAFRFETHDTLQCKNIVQMIVRHVDEQYDKNLTLRDIAARYAMNPNYLSILFKKATGLGFVEYVNHRRIDAACRILVNHPARSVSEIAESIGFGDTQYFFKLFKRIKGVTPLEYKRSQTV